MNLFDELKRDHRALLDLLRRAGRTSARSRSARTELLVQARAAFDTVAAVKETRLLPALRTQCAAAFDSEVGNGEEGSIEWRLVGSTDELAQARRLFDELLETDPGDRRWIVRLSLLEEHVERHVAADQRDLYPFAKRIEGLARPVAIAHPEPRRTEITRPLREPVASLWV